MTRTARPASASGAPPRAAPFDVLLVEDNPGDVDLTREALEEADPRVRLAVARDGEEALAVLRREGAHAGAPRPDLILLDLNLPRLDGHAVLAAIKADPALRAIPVVVLTSSAADVDVSRAYGSNANSYVTKPLVLEHFLDVVRGIDRFWFTVAKLPRRAG
jgi:CheY-like chemotaxis protein